MAQLPIKLTGIEDYLQDGEAYLKALIMGEASAGKTRSASFWPKPFYADCEKGRMSIADRRVPYVEITTSDQMFSLLDMLQRECMRPIEKRQYQTFVLDTLDAFQRKVIQERLRTERKEAMSGWQDWGYLDAKMTMLIERMLNLPMNVVVNLHIKSSQEGDDGPLVRSPKLKGDLREQIASDFDLVGHMSTYWMAEGGQRVLKRGIKWHPEPGFPILKDRSGRLPAFTEVTFTERDYTGLLEYFTAGLEDLEASTDVGVLELGDSAEPAPPDVPGGPVQPRPDKAMPVTSATKSGKKRAEVTAASNRPQPKPTITVIDDYTPRPDVTGVEPAAGAEPAPPPPAEAEDLVATQLGGQVVTDTAPADDLPQEPAPAAPAPQRARARKEEHEVPTCGTAGRMKDGTINKEPAPGCGKSLADENRDLMNIAFLRTRTYICAACWAAARANPATTKTA